MIVIGNGIYERCDNCKKLVRVNKFLFGSLHLCRHSQLRIDEERLLTDSDYEDALLEIEHPGKQQCFECCELFPKRLMKRGLREWGPGIEPNRPSEKEWYCPKCFAEISKGEKEDH